MKNFLFLLAMRKTLFFLSIFLVYSVSDSHAKEFEIFDGRMYNNKFYPLVDIIEWGEQNGEKPHIEFHVHMKDKPVGISVVPGDKSGKPVLWIMYDLSFRGEKVCRHVLAPAHFKEGMKLYTYRDDSDSDYDNIFISSEPMKGKYLKDYTMPNYQACDDEFASNYPGADSPVKQERKLSAESSAQKASDAAVVVPGANKPPEPKNIGSDYENQAVPFSF
ncbi:MAG: hypothetical protein M9962_09465 [Oligoflexia bacterium]|nr:hypothetical protein [Oligoflexia bacterium]